tara:strand:- start:148 stop:996 length:849 start_codon:yes stop_codon:yes gene_type:complete
MEKEKTILVPYDFTEVAENALLHANNIADAMKFSITLTNIVKNEKDQSDANKKLAKIAAINLANSGINTDHKIVRGNYLNKIGEIGEVVNAQFAVMGTHGMKGMQKVLGSHALKVITNSKFPYFITQGEPLHKRGFKNIVMYVDFLITSKQKVTWAVHIAKLFKSKLHIIKDFEKDEYTNASVERNTNFIMGNLNKNKIDFKLHELSKKNDGLVNETLKLSKEKDADLIIVMTTGDGEKGLSDVVFGKKEQALITNDLDIPVLCINPFDALLSKHGYSIIAR